MMGTRPVAADGPIPAWGRALPIVRRDARVDAIAGPAGVAVAYDISAGGLPVRVSPSMVTALRLLDQHADFESWAGAVSARHPELAGNQLETMLLGLGNVGLLSARAGSAGSDVAVPAALGARAPTRAPGATPGFAAPPPTSSGGKRKVTSAFKGVGALPTDAQPGAPLPVPSPMLQTYEAALQALEAGDLVRAESLLLLVQGWNYRPDEVEAHIGRLRAARALATGNALTPSASAFDRSPTGAFPMPGRSGFSPPPATSTAAAATAASRAAANGPAADVDVLEAVDVVEGDDVITADAAGTTGTNAADNNADNNADQAAADAPDHADNAGAAGADADGAVVEDATNQVERARADPAAVRRRWLRRLRSVVIVAAVIGAIVGTLAFVPVTFAITYEAEVHPVERGVVRAPADGIVADISAEEGGRVDKGAVLGRMVDSDQKLAVVKSTTAVERIRAELEQLRAGARPEEIDRALAAANGLAREVGLAAGRVQRLRGLVDRGVAPRDELERALADAASLNGQLAQARAQTKLLKAGSRPDDIKKKEAEQRSLEAQLELDQRVLASLRLVAPNAGVITSRRPEDKNNTRVQLGDAVLEIARLDEMRVEILVNERDYDVVEKGLPIVLKIAAYPTERFTGVVTRVAQQVERTDAGNVVRVEGIVPNAAGRLVPNMSGYAEIQAGETSLLKLLARRLVRYMRLRFFF